MTSYVSHRLPRFALGTRYWAYQSGQSASAWPISARDARAPPPRGAAPARGHRASCSSPAATCCQARPGRWVRRSSVVSIMRYLWVSAATQHRRSRPRCRPAEEAERARDAVLRGRPQPDDGALARPARWSARPRTPRRGLGDVPFRGFRGTAQGRCTKNSVAVFPFAGVADGQAPRSGVVPCGAQVRPHRTARPAAASRRAPARSAASAAANSPIVRHSPGASGGRHERSTWSWAASSRVCAASRARTSSTTWPGARPGRAWSW